MAYQHFYSRVPARFSMYNKIDGFDTFAHSSELSRDFILGELSAMYADKMRGVDGGSLRRGELPTVYAQAMLRPGVTVQSALTYIPVDYTGERSAYMVHSLVLSEEERSPIFANRGALPFNAAMFMKNIAPFRLTDRAGVANPTLPQADYRPLPMNNPMEIISKYHPETVKYLICALVSSLCGRGGEVCFRLPVSDRQASEQALSLVNALMCILPYQMRELLSFVSLVWDVNSYPGFRLKCIGRECKAPSPGRAVFIDFEKNQVTGFNDNIELHRPLVSFLYSLFENQPLRDEFHMYVSAVLATYPDKVLNLSTLGELVFLFWQCSGFFSEESVLPTDDSVYQIFSIYEKYRSALSDEYKMRLYGCLMRYYNQHRVIPQPIFAQIQSLYPGDTPAARAAALKVLLKLIHTDLMRERLFNLIAANYATEQVGVKAEIVSDISSVFYGGFLQHKILAFFDSIFDSESEENREVILDKLLLSIRTPAVQRRIVTFLDRHYDRLSPALKGRAYTTFLEMLPECDQLSALLIALVNKRVTKEPEKLRALLSQRVTGFLDADYTGGSMRLLPLLIEHSGFLDDLTVGFILTQRMDTQMYSHYLSLLAGMSAIDRAMRIVRALRTQSGIPAANCKKLITDFGTLECNLGTTNLYELMRADKYGDWLPPEQARLFRQVIIYPQAAKSLCDAFKVKYGQGGVEVALKYAEGKPALTESDNHRVLISYVRMTEFAADGDVSSAFNQAMYLPENQQLRGDIAEYIDTCLLHRGRQTVKTSFIYELIIGYLKTGELSFDSLYFKYKEVFGRKWEDKLEDKATPDKVECNAAVDSAMLMLDCAEELCYILEDNTDMVYGEHTGVDRALADLISIYGLGIGKLLKKYIRDGSFELRDIINEQIKERNARHRSVKGVIDLVNQSIRR